MNEMKAKISRMTFELMELIPQYGLLILDINSTDIDFRFHSYPWFHKAALMVNGFNVPNLACNN